MSAEKYTNTMISSWRKTNYIEDPEIAYKRIDATKTYKDGGKQSKNSRWNKQSYGPSNHMNKRYYDKGNIVLYQKLEKLPMICALI